MKFCDILPLVVAVEAAAVKRQFVGIGNSASVAQSFGLVAQKAASAPFLEETLKAQRFPDALRKQVVWGPYTLQGAKAKHSSGSGGIKLDRHSDLFEYNLGGLCKDCMVLDARIDVTDKTGKKLDLSSEVYTHHIILSNAGRAMTMPPITPLGFCAGAFPDIGQLASSLLGSPGVQNLLNGAQDLLKGFAPDLFKSLSVELDDPKAPAAAAPNTFGGAGGFGGFGGLFPGAAGGFRPVLIKGHEANHVSWASSNSSFPKSGMWIGKDDKILNSVEVVNYKQEPTDVYFTMDIEYRQFDKRPVDYMEVAFLPLIATDCADMMMMPPADKPKTYSTPDYSVSSEAHVMYLNPHLHDGALNMKLFVNDKLVCNREAIYGEDTSGKKLNGKAWETIASYTPCDVIKLNKGDKIKMSSDYDLTKHRLRPSSADHSMGTESMAMAFTQFAYRK